MSTRAIIGMKEGDAIVGAWCWSDGNNVIYNLKKDFRTEEGAKFLINMGTFNTIFFREDAEEFKEWRRANGIPSDETEFITYGESVVLREKRHETERAGRYADLEEAMDQDVNVVYLFESGQWKTYR